MSANEPIRTEDAEKLVKSVMDEFTQAELYTINKEAEELFLGSVEQSDTDLDLSSLASTWTDTVNLLTKYITAAANAIVKEYTPDKYKNTEEYIELKNMITQYRFFGRLVSLANRKPKDKAEHVNKITLDKLPGESDAEHRARLEKYLHG